MRQLGPYADCVFPCGQCPGRDLSPNALRALNTMADLFDPTVEGALPVGDDWQMRRTAEILAEAAGASERDAPKIVAAVGKVISPGTINHCPNTVRGRGA